MDWRFLHHRFGLVLLLISCSSSDSCTGDYHAESGESESDATIPRVVTQALPENCPGREAPSKASFLRNLRVPACQSVWTADDFQEPLLTEKLYSYRELAYNAYAAREFEAAKLWLEQCVTVLRALPKISSQKDSKKDLLKSTLFFLGDVAIERGDLAQANRLFDEAGMLPNKEPSPRVHAESVLEAPGCRGSLPKAKQPLIEQIHNKLEIAYKSRSSEKLEILLEEWRENVLPCDNSALDRDLREVYKVFLAFYLPFNLAVVCPGTGRGIDFCTSKPYVIVQHSIQFQIGSGLLTRLLRFRPPVAFSEAEPLYMSPSYEEALLRFLDNEDVPQSEDRIVEPSCAKGESKMRAEFLKEYVCILPGHWRGWHLETHPHVETIKIDAHRTLATVFFRVGSHGGEAAFRRKGNRWTLVESRLTWIE